MRSFRPSEFNPRADKSYPEYSDKLSQLYKDQGNRASARELADTLDEPIDINIDTGDSEKFKIPEVPKDYHNIDGPYFTHTRYVMWANANGYPELKFTDEIIPEAVDGFASAEGLDYKKTLSAVNFSLSNVKKAQIKMGLNKFDVNKQMADVHGFDQDPFGYDPFEED